MEYLIAGLAGFVYGAVLGTLKYLLLWRPMILGRRKFNALSITATQIISMVLNFLILLGVYFLRYIWPIWPYSFETTIIGAAVALVLVGRFASFRETRKIQTLPDSTEETKTDLQKKD